MAPTLIGNTSKRVHYGIADNHESALKNLNRFDVVITYYPDTWTADTETYKIKRVWGFPGETLYLQKLDDGSCFFTAKRGEETVYSIQGTPVNKTFEMM